MRYVTITLVMAYLLQTICYADEVHYNAPMGGGTEGSLCLQQLVYTQKDLDKQKFERDVSVREMNYMKEESHVGTAILWTVIGIAAGGTAVYFGVKK